MATVTYRHGDPVMIDHTASADITAGDVVVLGNTAGLTCGVAHSDIANTDVGAIAAGRGVYDIKMADTSTAVGTTVYYDESASCVTSTSTANILFGYLVEATAAVNTTVKVLHIPYT